MSTILKVDDINVYYGSIHAIKGISFEVNEGEIVTLIGANGAGKSTFLKILSGQLDTTKGDIVITPGQRLSVLEQDHFKYDDNVVMDTVIMGNKRLYDNIERLPSHSMP